MNLDFSEWLQGMLDERGWSQSELARRANTTSTTVSRVINRDRLPGVEFCRGVAEAFGMQDIEVLRIAGLASPAPKPSTLRDKLTSQLEEMTEEQLSAMERYARALLTEQMLESFRAQTPKTKPRHP